MREDVAFQGMRNLGLKRMCAVVSALLAAACLPREQDFHGRVVDVASGAPVADAEIVVWSRAWGITDGSLLWDKQYVFHDKSSPDGRFRITHRGAWKPHLCARAPGYHTTRLQIGSMNGGSEVGLVRRTPQPPKIRSGLLLLGTSAEGRVLGWNFTEEQPVDPGRADLMLRSEPELQTPLTFFAPGGIRAAPPAPYGGGISDGEAPQSGYVTELTIDPRATSTIFVRTRNKQRYARLEFSQEFSLSTYPPGQKALQIRYLFDPDGGRFLRSETLVPYCPF